MQEPTARRHLHVHIGRLHSHGVGCAAGGAIAAAAGAHTGDLGGGLVQVQ